MSARDYETALASIDRDGRIIALVEKINRAHTEDLAQLHSELAELRDGMVALSNRIEAVTRTASPAHPRAPYPGPRQPSS